MEYHYKGFTLVVCLLQHLQVTHEQYTGSYLPKIWEMFNPGFRVHSEMPQPANLASVFPLK